MLVVFFVTLIDLRIYVRIYKYFSSFSSLLLYLLFVWRIFSAVVFVPLDVCVNAMFHLFSVAAFIIWLSFYLKRCSDSECLTYICRYSNHSVLVCPVQRIRLCAWCHSYRTQNTTLFHINNTHIYRVSCRVIVTVITGTRCFFRCVCAFRRIFCMTDVCTYNNLCIRTILHMDLRFIVDARMRAHIHNWLLWMHKDIPTHIHIHSDRATKVTVFLFIRSIWFAVVRNSNPIIMLKNKCKSMTSCAIIFMQMIYID